MNNIVKTILVIKFIVGFTCFGVIIESKAVIDNDLHKFVESFGLYYNTNSPAIYQDQAAGHITGGGGLLRNRVKNIQPFNVELPKVSYGNCGDIDIFSGSFSWISADELTDTLKNIGSSAAAYATMLAMETISPQIANNIKQLQSWSNQINQINLNSCELGASAAAAIWPQSQAASNAICRDRMVAGGIAGDYIQGRHKCSDKNTRKKQNNEADKENPEIIKQNSNVAWQLLSNDQLIKDSQLKHLFMSLSGTIVTNDSSESGKPQISWYPSKIEDNNFLKKLLNGGSLELYGCGESGKDPKCLNVQKRIYQLSKEASFGGKVTRLLNGMQTKILSGGGSNDQPFDEEEKSLLQKTNLPILKLINLVAASRNGYSSINLMNYSEEIAIDIMCQYLQEIMQLIRTNAEHKKFIQVDATNLNSFISSLDKVETIIKDHKIKAQNKLKQEILIAKRVKLLEQAIFSDMESYTDY